jgi:hypothetical protein
MPVYEKWKRCSFSKGINLGGKDLRGFWMPYGDTGSTCWSKEKGHNGTGCLKTASDRQVDVWWRQYIVEMWHFLPIMPGKRYQLSLWVKTEKLKGEGVYIQYRFVEDYYKRGQVLIPARGRTVSPKIKGTGSWKRTVLKTGRAPAVARYIYVTLHHKGSGTSWMDDFTIRETR